jgi:hypothetical protein
MYFRHFVVEFDEEEKATEHGCSTVTGYEVLAVSPTNPSDYTRREEPFPPQQTYLLIRNDSGKLQWVPESLVRVAKIE